MDFGIFKQAVAAQYERMQAHPMFRAEISGQELWDKTRSAHERPSRNALP